GARPSQHGHSSDPSTTFSGPSSLNLSTRLRSVMVILLRPPPLVRQGAPLLTNKTLKHLSPAAASPITERRGGKGLLRSGATPSTSARGALQFRRDKAQRSDRNGA